MKDIVYGVVMAQLDTNYIYSFRDKTETFWKFSWEKITDITAWWAWKKGPSDAKYLCQGTIAVDKIVTRLNDSPSQLGADDLIDLNLWLDSGGLDEYTPDPNREFPDEQEEFRSVAEMTGWIPPEINSPGLDLELE